MPRTLAEAQLARCIVVGTGFVSRSDAIRLGTRLKFRLYNLGITVKAQEFVVWVRFRRHMRAEVASDSCEIARCSHHARLGLRHAHDAGRLGARLLSRQLRALALMQTQVVFEPSYPVVLRFAEVGVGRGGGVAGSIFHWLRLPTI